MIRSAVIGAGQVAHQHLACVAQLPGVRLAGVCDLSRALAESASERYGARSWFTDHRRMLAELQPDIVHVTTPPASHFSIARDCLDAGAHVFVEKPASERFADFVALRTLAQAKRRWLIEDYNYVYNAPVRRLFEWTQQGVLGDLVHAEVILCAGLLDEASRFADPNLRHPALDLEGGAIADLLPHLAALAYFSCGPVRSVRTVWEQCARSSPLPYDEFRAVLRGERATGTLVVSARSQPDLFRITLFGTRAHASADIYENRLTRACMRPVPKPLVPFCNAMEQASTMRRSAWRLLWRKLGGGPGVYEGLWTLIRSVYESIAGGRRPPLSAEDMFEVNRLVDELKAERNRM
jgi:predicted dehydrogenase